EIFLRTALVEGEWETGNPLVRANRTVIEEAEQMTDRMRRPDLLISDDALYAFYDARVPSDVVSGPTFDKWLRSIPRDDWPSLMIDDAIVDATQLRPSDFPDRWTF